jgi:hypothetical protein
MRHKVFPALASGLLVVCLSLVCSTPADCAVIHVKPTGWDANDGLTWETAKRSVSAGLDAAEPGDEVWVSAGTYYECIVLTPGVGLFGGFTGLETSRSARNWQTNVTILDGRQKGDVVTATVGSPPTTRIDGFTVRNGLYGIEGCLTVTNNIVTGNTTCGVDVGGSSIVTRNTIIGNQGECGAGLIVGGSSYVSGNLITRNAASDSGGGVVLMAYDRCLRFSNNTVTENTARRGGGVCCGGGQPSFWVSNNIIARNTAIEYGGGVYATSLSGHLTNNTIVGNSAGAGGGVCFETGCDGMEVFNNIIAFNSSGLARLPPYNTYPDPLLGYNDVCNPGGQNYSGLSPGPTDISADPTFVDAVNGDYHLQLISPCINAGSNADVGPGWLDIDGEVRILPDGEVVDIGADEYSAHAVWSPANAKKVVSDGAEAVIKGRNRQAMVTTARLPDVPAFYVEQADRSVGLQCRGSSLLEPGQAALLLGIMSTIEGERVLTGATAVEGTLCAHAVPDPFALCNRSLGGGPFGLQPGISGAVGLNNIGLLVKTSGTVTYAEQAFFYLDDGSVLDDHSGHIGVKVYGTVPVNPGEEPVGKFVTVTGISSCEIAGGDIVRVIRTRDAQDVVVLR